MLRAHIAEEDGVKTGYVDFVDARSVNFAMDTCSEGKRFTLKNSEGKRHPVTVEKPQGGGPGCSVCMQNLNADAKGPDMVEDIRDMVEEWGYVIQIEIVQVFNVSSHLLYPYIPLNTLIYPYIPLHTLIYPYIPSYTLIYPYIPLYTLIHPFIPLYTLTYPYILSIGSFFSLFQ